MWTLISKNSVKVFKKQKRTWIAINSFSLPCAELIVSWSTWTQTHVVLSIECACCIWEEKEEKARFCELMIAAVGGGGPQKMFRPISMHLPSVLSRRAHVTAICSRSRCRLPWGTWPDDFCPLLARRRRKLCWKLYRKFLSNFYKLKDLWRVAFGF